MNKTPQLRSTFRSCHVEKVHAVVARSTFRIQKRKKLPVSEHFWKLRCSKGVRRCGAKHISKSICAKHHMFAPLSRDCAPCQKWAKREAFVLFPKTMAGVGHLKRICKDAFSVAGAVQETCSSDLLGVRALISWDQLHFGASDLQFWEDDFAWRVQYSVWPGITFSRQAQYFRQVEWKNVKRIGTRPSALHSTFHVWRKSRRIVSFLMLSTSKIEEVSQNCFVFDVVKFKNWGSLAELFRFQAYR